MGLSNGDQKLLIINADDFGMCCSTNQAIGTLFEEKAITSSSLMMTCPWMTQAANLASTRCYDVGVHLTFTSEWKNYKWGPISSFAHPVPFVDEFGHFPEDVAPVGLAIADDIKQECIAQIECALQMGVDVTHLDNHMLSLQIGSAEPFMNTVIELCANYGLPLRMPRQTSAPIPHNEKLIRLADNKGVKLPDYVVVLPFHLPSKTQRYSFVIEHVSECLRNLKPGVTEIVFHPSVATNELMAITDTWEIRHFEYMVFREPLIQSIIHEQNIQLIGWKELRSLQRGE
ncbi:polysaccharide deacetylase family protein [Paenibacillus sp. GCM10027628]|uniref:polysaccharide deacetylase family protein n=1 Tax=Paenibacillus sp. GCM10027628 TaxID=3273413 RepID=UPI003638909A